MSGEVRISQVFDPEALAQDFNAILQTPNHQRILFVKATKQRLLVYTKSAIYYWRGRGQRRLRLWKRL